MLNMFYDILLALTLFLKLLSCRDSQLGAEEISIPSSGPVKSMAAMILRVLLLKWKEKQRRKLKDTRRFLKKDTKS